MTYMKRKKAVEQYYHVVVEEADMSVLEPVGGVLDATSQSFL